MTISTQSSKNIANQNSALNPIKTRRAPYPSFKLISVFTVILSTLIFCSCEVTYPAKTLSIQLKKIVKEEHNLDIVSRVSGKTLWAYLPLPNLLEDKKSAWNTTELEKTGKVLSTMQRVVLSTDAKIDFIALATADTRQFGIELISIEYIADIKEAMLERFSRGEFILRNVRDVNVNPKAIGDTKGVSQTFRDISLEEFLSLQIINRVKMLFTKDAQLIKLFELKSTGWKTRFSTLNLEFEFIRKKYDMDSKEQALDPLNFVKMTTAQALRNYDSKKIQAVNLTDTFTQKTVKLTQADLKKIKIHLPDIID